MLAAATGLLLATSTSAQVKAGKITYERTVQMQILFTGSGMENMAPKSRTDRLELNFADDKMTLRKIEEDLPEENLASGGMVIRTFGGGADDVTFCDFSQQRKVEAREMFDKKFLITDSIKRGSWKLTEETKNILGYNCRKATMVRISKRMMMNMENGELQRKEVQDTTTMAAWFTMDIPVPGGPEMQGQLPGMILELETGTGRLSYKAVEVSPKADMKALKEPTKGKKLTQEEYNKERTAMLEEMQKNNPGGNRRIRME